MLLEALTSIPAYTTREACQKQLLELKVWLVKVWPFYYLGTTVLVTPIGHTENTSPVVAASREGLHADAALESDLEERNLPV